MTSAKSELSDHGIFLSRPVFQREAEQLGIAPVGAAGWPKSWDSLPRSAATGKFKSCSSTDTDLT